MRKILIVFYTFISLSYIYSQNREYLYGPNCLEKRQGMGVEISRKEFDSLLIYTQSILLNRAWSEWKVEDCVTTIRIYNTIWLKRLNAIDDTTAKKMYDNYYIVVFGMMNPIWWVIEPRLLEYPTIIKYYSEKYDIETFKNPGSNSYYAVIKNSNGTEE